MQTLIDTALKKIFERHRIVFWYDGKLEFRDDFEVPENPCHDAPTTEEVNANKEKWGYVDA